MTLNGGPSGPFAPLAGAVSPRGRPSFSSFPRSQMHLQERDHARAPARGRRTGRMDFRNLVFGGAALGVLAACWQHVKSFGWRIAGLLVRRVEIPSETAHQTLIAYLVANFKRYRNYDSMYGADF